MLILLLNLPSLYKNDTDLIVAGHFVCDMIKNNGAAWNGRAIFSLIKENQSKKISPQPFLSDGPAKAYWACRFIDLDEKTPEQICLPDSPAPRH